MSDMPDDPATSGRSGSWWSTLPGMLTAAAGLITAVTALLVALNGIFGGPSAPQASNRAVSSDATDGGARITTTTIETRATEASDGGRASTYKVAFPRGTRLTGGIHEDVVYDFLGGAAEPLNPGALKLALTVRATSKNPSSSNFSSTDFRLRVGDTNRAATNFFSEVVQYKTSIDRVVEFDVPEAAGTFTLIALTGYGGAGGEVKLPIALRSR